MKTVFVVLPNYGCEGLGQPEACFDSIAAAEEYVRLEAPEYHVLVIFEIEVQTKVKK